ncbi:MAG TPA: TlpA disulfide reductase family protein [Desulfomonilia bacterium]
MKKRLIVTLATLFLMSFMAASVFAANNPKAPDFTLQDMNGKSVSLNSFKGKNVLLYFTTTWCPYCKKEVPELKEMHKKYKGKLEIMAIDMNESKAKVSSYIEKYQIPYTTLLDSDGSVGIDYSVRGVPTKILIGKDGRVFCYMCRDLPNQIEELLRKK